MCVPSPSRIRQSSFQSTIPTSRRICVRTSRERNSKHWMMADTLFSGVMQIRSGVSILRTWKERDIGSVISLSDLGDRIGYSRLLSYRATALRSSDYADYTDDHYKAVR